MEGVIATLIITGIVIFLLWAIISDNEPKESSWKQPESIPTEPEVAEQEPNEVVIEITEEDIQRERDEIKARQFINRFIDEIAKTKDEPMKENKIDKAIDTSIGVVKKVANEINTSRYINETPQSAGGKLFKLIIIIFVILGILVLAKAIFDY